MATPITDAANTPAIDDLLQQLNALMPDGTALFVVAVGPLRENMLREIGVGGALDDADSLRIASQVLAERGKPGFGMLRKRTALKARMH